MKFGDKVHQFLRRIGIKETETVNAYSILKDIESLAKDNNVSYHSLEVKISRHRESDLYEYQFTGYIHPSRIAYDATPELMMQKLRATTGIKSKPIVKDIIL